MCIYIYIYIYLHTLYVHMCVDRQTDGQTDRYTDWTHASFRSPQGRLHPVARRLPGLLLGHGQEVLADDLGGEQGSV